MTIDDDLLTVEQAAKELGLTVGGLRTRIARARRRGKPEPFELMVQPRFGTKERGRLVVDRDALRRWDETFRRRTA